MTDTETYVVLFPMKMASLVDLRSYGISEMQMTLEGVFVRVDKNLAAILVIAGGIVVDAKAWRKWQ